MGEELDVLGIDDYFIQVLIVTLNDRSDVLPDWPAVTRPRVQRYTRGRTANGLGVNVTQTPTWYKSTRQAETRRTPFKETTQSVPRGLIRFGKPHQ